MMLLLCMSCNEEVELYDFEKYKYVSFVDEEITVSENYGTKQVEEGKMEEIPIYLQYDGSTLEEDFSVELGVIEENVTEGEDYNLSTKTVTVKAGSLLSEPSYLTLIDDLVSTEDDRKLIITIESVSNPNIDIGVGIVNQSNKEIVINILDDECSETIDIFDSPDLVNSTEWGDYNVTGLVSGNEFTVKGNLIAYGPFENAELKITLTPIVEGATSGKATFDQQVTGTDNDGYQYAFKQIGEGSYDVCTGTIDVEYEVYYESGGAWVYWYSLTNTFKTP